MLRMVLLIFVMVSCSGDKTSSENPSSPNSSESNDFPVSDEEVIKQNLSIAGAQGSLLLEEEPFQVVSQNESLSLNLVCVQGSSFEYQVNDQAWQDAGTCQNSTLSLIINATNNDEVRLRLKDSADALKLNVQIDTTAPNAPIINSSISSYLINAASTSNVIFQGSCEAEDHILTLNLSDQSSNSHEFKAICQSNQTFTGIITDFNELGLSDGQIDISVSETDLAKNVSVSAASSFQLDLNAPNAPSIDSSVASTDITSSNNTSFSVTGTCAEQGNTLSFEFNDSSSSINASTTCLSDNTYSVATDLSSFSHGSTVSVSAAETDAASNESQPTSISLSVDLIIAPTLSYADQVLATGEAASINATLNNGGDSSASCSALLLPTGLSVNSSTCEISGTPSAAQASTSASIRITNSHSSVDASFSITITDIQFTSQDDNKAYSDADEDVVVSLSHFSAGQTLKVFDDACSNQIGSATATGASTQDVSVSSQLSSAGSFSFYAQVDSGACKGPLNVEVADCPSGYTYVPETLPHNQDFCVMVYEARNDGADNISVDPNDSIYNNISALDARTACIDLGVGYDIISNPEWMAIARNLEANDSNWSNGTRGDGTMARGYARGGNTSVASSTGSSCESNDANNSCSSLQTGSSFQHNRTMLLSTGVKIWDFSGNAEEWVDFDANDSIFTTSSCVSSNADGTYNEFDVTSCSNLSDDDYKSAFGYTSTQRIGRIFNTDNTGVYLLRGGDYNDTNSSGIFNISFSSNTGLAGNKRGFRCVYRH